MNRLCNKLRQGLTPVHLDQLMVIALEGSDNMTQDQLREFMYHRDMMQARRI